jgi:hypothetical protein
MRAPLARVRIETQEARKRRRSGTSRRPAPLNAEAEVSETEEAAAGDDPPRFYPFPLRRGDDSDG